MGRAKGKDECGTSTSLRQGALAHRNSGEVSGMEAWPSRITLVLAAQLRSSKKRVMVR
jgi:hypothetical protein